ncbi:MAG: TetM/TetW/TetO/TetS family tetracycline resistance ribosomal protection protein [Bacillota bacterium]|nr:TetM/TetW/TetO/TetS family tetracycline resistance ribosomal protection protein [Bacillota bacterium]
MSNEETESPAICIGILAHVDAGKTTLTERLLQHAGVIQTAGSVDQGTAQTDYLAVERARGISVRAASARLEWRGRTINLIDTPGHRDFEGEVQRSLKILDAAILCLSAVEGIEAQSEVHWRRLAARGLPVLLFVNKTDRAGADVGAVLGAMRRLAGRPLLPLAEPDAWLAELVENDAELADAWLAGERVPGKRLEEALVKQFRAGEILPWLAGSALQDRGIRPLLDAIARLVRSRLEAVGGESFAYIYKVEQDRRLGRLAHVRLLAGELENRQMLWNPRTGESAKIVQIRQVSGARAVDSGRLDRGDVAALAGFRSVRAGDVLTDEEGDPAARWEEPAPALLRVELRVPDASRRPELVAACRELEAEEPGLRPLELPETGALLLHVTGVVQIEVLTETLAGRFGLEVEVGTPEVVYRETPARVAEAEDHYTMPKPCWAVTRFRVEPLPPGSGLRYESVVPDTRISYRYQGQVEQTVPLVLEQGVYG